MNYSYITLLNTENYLKGVVCLNESLKRAGSKYPLTVAITKNISEDTISILRKNDIKIVYIDNMDVPEEIKEKNKKGMFSHWSNTFDKLKIFELTEFDKLVFLDSDMYVRKNIDELFEKENLSAVIDRKEPDVIEDWKKLTSGTLVIKPKKGITKDFIKIMKEIIEKRDSIGDQDILQEYDKDWENKKHLHLDVKYNTFFIYLDYYVENNEYKLDDIAVIHFILKTKPWELTDEKIDEYLQFLNNRLEFNYEKTKKEVYKKCLDVGSENKRKILNEYIDILEKLKKEDKL